MMPGASGVEDGEILEAEKAGVNMLQGGAVPKDKSREKKHKDRKRRRHGFEEKDRKRRKRDKDRKRSHERHHSGRKHRHRRREEEWERGRRKVEAAPISSERVLRVNQVQLKVAEEVDAEEQQLSGVPEVVDAERVGQQLTELEQPKEETEELTREERRARRLQRLKGKLASAAVGSVSGASRQVPKPTRPPLSPKRTPPAAVELGVRVSKAGKEEEPPPHPDANEDDFDMFSVSPSKIAAQDTTRVVVHGTKHELDWDDKEGYYVFKRGDLLNQRYRVFANQGRGVFSSVLRVHDTICNNKELVVKVIRNNDTMYKAGLKELEFLRLLRAADPDNKYHCVRLESHFEYKNHLCMVFEAFSLNLREVLKKFGSVGINIVAVKSYAKQLFTALLHLKRCGILHADIKPDNVLASEMMNVIKLCDFGSASRKKDLNFDVDITPYLISRFYRPPEVILGLQYDEAVDIWSVGCVLAELFTGKILFQGKDNNEMLLLFQELSGAFPKKMLRKGRFTEKHFDPELNNFLQHTVDSVTKDPIIMQRSFKKPTRSIREELLGSSRPSPQEREKINQLADLLTQSFMLDPARRLTVEQALHHPFVRA